MPRIDVGPTTLHYQQTGAGPDIVLLHGFTSNLAMWMFSGIVSALADRYRVTCYDLRGHGLSEAPRDGYTSDQMAHDYLALREKIGLGPAVMIGHSFGGVVAMHTALIEPDAVTGVILSDSYFPGLAHLEPNLEHAEVWQDLRGTLHKVGTTLPSTIDFDALFTVIKNLTPEQSQAIEDDLGPAATRWLSQIPQLGETTAARETFEAAGLTADALRRIKHPVVALYDEHTPFRATCDFLVENLPNAVEDVVPEAKHLALLENPTAFVELVERYLKRLAPVSSEPPPAQPTHT